MEIGSYGSVIIKLLDLGLRDHLRPESGYYMSIFFNNLVSYQNYTSLENEISNFEGIKKFGKKINKKKLKFFLNLEKILDIAIWLRLKEECDMSNPWKKFTFIPK